MKELLLSYKYKRYFFLLILFTFILILVSPLKSGDFPHYYLQANLIHEIGIFNYISILFNSQVCNYINNDLCDPTRPYFLYFFFTLFIYLIKIIFLSYWENAFILVNLIFTGIIYLKLFNLLKSKIELHLIFSILFLINIEQNIWNLYILGDVFINFLISLLFFSIISSYPNKSINFKSIVFYTFFSFLIFFSKPTGFLIIIFFVFIFIFISIESKINIDNLLFYSLFIISVVFIFLSIIISNLSSINTDWGKSWNLIKFIEDGIIINTDSENKIVKIDMGNNSFGNIFFYFLYKFIYFFKFWKFDLWSFEHNFISIFVSIPLYISFLYSLIFYKNYSLTNKRNIMICSSLIFAVAIFHTLTFIDRAFRFRLPAYTPLYFILALNLNLLHKRFQNKLPFFKK